MLNLIVTGCRNVNDETIAVEVGFGLDPTDDDTVLAKTKIYRLGSRENMEQFGSAPSMAMLYSIIEEILLEEFECDEAGVKEVYRIIEHSLSRIHRD